MSFIPLMSAMVLASLRTLKYFLGLRLYLEYALAMMASSFDPRQQNSLTIASVIDELNLTSVPLNRSF